MQAPVSSFSQEKFSCIQDRGPWIRGKITRFSRQLLKKGANEKAKNNITFLPAEHPNFLKVHLDLINL
jgi:hypothetical protein